MAAKKRFKDKSAMRAYSEFISCAKRKRRLKLSTNDPSYEYLANHHVYPCCLVKEDTGLAVLADNSEANLVLLTFEEHVQAHILLAAVYAEHYGLQTVAKRMLASRCSLDGSPLALAAAEQNAIALGKRNMSLESRQRSSIAATARNNANAEQGLHPWATDSYKAEASERQILAYAKGEHSFQRPEVIAAAIRTIREQAAQGLHHSQATESREAMRMLAYVPTKCPHCCKVTAALSAKAHHFDNCKLLTCVGATCDTAESSNWLTCEICDKLCYTQRGLRSHVAHKHKPTARRA